MSVTPRDNGIPGGQTVTVSEVEDSDSLPRALVPAGLGRQGPTEPSSASAPWRLNEPNSQLNRNLCSTLN
jgi:hypothetical protein